MLALETSGSPEWPAVLLVHGFLGRGSDWAYVLDALADRYFVVAPDLPGHGGSVGFPLEKTLEYSFVFDELLATMQRLGKQEFTLVGYSLGGRVALHGALRHPRRVSALVLESVSPGLDAQEERRARRCEDDARARELLQEGLPRFLDRWYEQPLFASLQARPELLARQKREKQSNELHWMAKTLRELSPGAVPSLWTDVARLKTPTLLVVGEQDAKYGRLAEELARRLPESTRIVVEGAGHNVHLEEPESFARELRSFLSRQEATDRISSRNHR